MKNLSNKSIRQLAEIHVEGFDPQNPNDLYDHGVRVVAVYPLPLCAADPEALPEPLQDLLEEGEDLDTLFNRPVDADFLSGLGGFLLQFQAQRKDFSKTVFKKDGHMDHCSSWGWGCYNTLFVWAPTWDAVIAELRKEYVNHIERLITFDAKQKN